MRGKLLQRGIELAMPLFFSAVVFASGADWEEGKPAEEMRYRRVRKVKFSCLAF